MYTKEKFREDLDILEKEYCIGEWDNASILEFLDSEGWNDPNVIKLIDPYWVLTELHRMNMHNEMGDMGDWSIRFKILMGLNEKINYVHNPHFKTYDLIKWGDTIYVVMNYVFKGEFYEIEDVNSIGESHQWAKEVIESKCVKIGEVTKDVLKSGGWNNKK